MMHPQKTILQTISIIVICASVLVIIGWLTGTEFLVKVFYDMPTTKILSALFFILCGSGLFLKEKIFIESKKSFMLVYVIISTLSICLVLLCAATIINPTIGFVLDVFPREIFDDNWSRLPFMPSIISLMLFFVLSFGNLSLICFSKITIKLLPYVAWTCLLVGVLAIIGNILEIPGLFFVSKFSGGMSIISAFLFACVGMHYLIFSKLIIEKN